MYFLLSLLTAFSSIITNSYPSGFQSCLLIRQGQVLSSDLYSVLKVFSPQPVFSTLLPFAHHASLDSGLTSWGRPLRRRLVAPPPHLVLPRHRAFSHGVSFPLDFKFHSRRERSEFPLPPESPYLLQWQAFWRDSNPCLLNVWMNKGLNEQMSAYVSYSKVWNYKAARVPTFCWRNTLRN